MVVSFWCSGAYDDEQVAAHAYDLAALKYWGPDTILNFPVRTFPLFLLWIKMIMNMLFCLFH